MAEYSEKNADISNRKTKISKRILIIVYLCIWALPIAVFWIVGLIDALAYAVVVFYFVLPLDTIIASIFIGKGEEWRDIRWIMLIFFGLMYMLSYYLTFSLANMTIFHKLNELSVEFMLPGILLSALGMCIGTVIRIILKKKNNYRKREKSETK